MKASIFALRLLPMAESSDVLRFLAQALSYESYTQYIAGPFGLGRILAGYEATYPTSFKENVKGVVNRMQSWQDVATHYNDKNIGAVLQLLHAATTPRDIVVVPHAPVLGDVPFSIVVVKPKSKVSNYKRVECAVQAFNATIRVKVVYDAVAMLAGLQLSPTDNFYLLAVPEAVAMLRFEGKLFIGGSSFMELEHNPDDPESPTLCVALKEISPNAESITTPDIGAVNTTRVCKKWPYRRWFKFPPRTCQLVAPRVNGTFALNERFCNAYVFVVKPCAVTSCTAVSAGVAYCKPGPFFCDAHA